MVFVKEESEEDMSEPEPWRIKHEEQGGFTVRGPSGPLFVPLGSSVVLPCYVDELLPMEDLEVEWRRTDSETLVHLYQDGESRPEAQQQEYHDRAHFFTDQIQHGNFSLRLDNLRPEDKGVYRCKIYSQQVAVKTLVEIKDVEYLLVSGLSHSISASVGEDVTLDCSVDSHIIPEHFEEVKWIKTDDDILVLLYQNNKIIPDSSDEQYRDRVEFFTDEIPKGNFSLRLKSVRSEDKGVYMCQVFAGGLSANATVVLDRLDFSTLHIMVLLGCIAEASGASLLLCYQIYSRSKNTVTSRRISNLQVSLVICSNVFLFFAFIFWGFVEVTKAKRPQNARTRTAEIYPGLKVYVELPSVERSMAMQLCPKTATSWWGKACTASGEASSALHSMVLLQVYQAKALKELHKGNSDPGIVQELPSAMLKKCLAHPIHSTITSRQQCVAQECHQAFSHTLCPILEPLYRCRSFISSGSG
ncbi:uncharacterized protein [Chanodichthys erythropterus]|uniref:uncharacterized protein n=1 Tax=Chanodichthys erythropterus TaxID=933992 RepID=UPI00351E6E15